MTMKKTPPAAAPRRGRPSPTASASAERGGGRGNGAASGGDVPSGRRGVRGGGEATRKAILEAAREQFSARGYDQVGLREIAAAAGATAALVNRYFGTKELLFRAVLDSGRPRFFGRLLADRASFGDTVARLIVHGEQAPDGQGGTAASQAPGNVSFIVHSLASPAVMGMLRELLDEELVPRLADWLGGQDARLRAEAVYACFLGVHALKQVVGTAALKGAGAERLVAVLAPMLQACVDGGAPATAPRAAESSSQPRDPVSSRRPSGG